MDNKLTKKCANCPIFFKANSNHQKYCLVCKPLVRKIKNSKWQNTYYMKNKESKLEGYRAYNKTEKGRASQKLRDAVRQGKIIRQSCEVCSEPDAQGHHTDYSKPLDVKWLCAKHHREEHLFEPWKNNLRRAGYNDGFLLGKLIEACGERIYSLRRTHEKDKWVAHGYDIPNTDITMIHLQMLGEKGFLGSNPEEAVANLWLELHNEIK